ncbi:hypothetical protein AB0F18_08200 [Streptomyces sp. NPDC029216]|uniref:hypothetical protein n=1 Tax=Streptomyces sp. NPDC029216 TaxID=3154701 RepID=UPI0033C06FB6
MGRQERYRKVLRPLLGAGIEVLPDGVPASAVPHVLGYERERIFGGFFVDYDDPRLVERLNEGWYGLATASGLIDENREFLLMLPRGTWTAAVDRRQRHKVHVWHRVRLLDRWDVMGAGAASFLGIRAGHPGFAMLALDSSVWLLADTYESGVGVYAVREPARSPGVLRGLAWLAEEDVYKDPEFRRDVTAWLEGWAATSP